MIENIEIQNCPLCSKSHEYKLKVTRSTVLRRGFKQEFNDLKMESKYTRFFTCPIENKVFEATIVLSQTPGNRISEVSILGIKDE